MKHKYVTPQACMSWESTVMSSVCVEIGKVMLTNIAVIWGHGFELASCYSG